MNQPLITICMMVYNGEEFLADAVQSFLDQTCKSFELVIYDNASTDRSPQIAAALATRDDRIRVVRHRENIGALMNFVGAAEGVTTPYFCWAAHDDRRDARFLEVLLESMRRHPEADLAACGSLELDPDGTPRAMCKPTSKLRTTSGLNSKARLCLYLRHSPCSPIYGLFRTATLRNALPLLAANEQAGGNSVFGGDLVFLAGFLKDHHMTFTSLPLLMLRGGGVSHRPDSFRGILHLIREIGAFHRRLKAVTRATHAWDRVHIAAARWRLLLRYLTWPPMLRLFEYHLLNAVPFLKRLRTFCLVRGGAFGRLRRRARQLPAQSRIGIFGAGKHTRRHLNTIRAALGREGVLVAIGDDRAERMEPLSEMPILSAEQFAAHPLDLIIISSDTYEKALHARAQAITNGRTPIWCIHDTSLEIASSRAVSPARAAVAVAFRKSSMASMAS